jgi:DNA polymerase-3 subunit epsilon
MRNILGRLHGHSQPSAADSPRAASPALGGFAVLDFETTGLFPGGHDRVVEIGIVHIDINGVIEGTWDTLVNPQRDLGKQSIHHINASDILDAPTFAQAAPELVELLSGRVLVAHNAQFDTGFLDEEFTRIGYTPNVPFAVLCTMLLAADITPGAGRSLADCCSHFDIRIDGAHRAHGDAEATAQLLGEYIHATPRESLWADAVASASAAWTPIPGERTPWKPRPAADHVPPHFLERIAIRLPEHAGPEAEQSYLALLDRILIDHHISAHEADDLVQLANSLELGRVACERLQLAYFQALVIIPEPEIQKSLTPPDAGTVDPELLEEVLAIQLAEFKLRVGDLVVLSGAMIRPREDWAAELESLDLVWINYINKKVRVLAAADPDSLSGKAAKARDYGISIVSEDGLTRLVADFAGP